MLDTSIPAIPEQIEDGLPSPAIESSNCSFETFRREQEGEDVGDYQRARSAKEIRNRNIRLTLNWLAPNNGKKLKTREVDNTASSHVRSISSNSTYSDSTQSVADFPQPPTHAHIQHLRHASSTPTTSDDRSDLHSISSASLFTRGEEVYTPPPGVGVGVGVGMGVYGAPYYNGQTYALHPSQSQHSHAQTNARHVSHMQHPHLYNPASHPHPHPQPAYAPPPVPTNSRPQNGTLYTKEGLPIDVAQLVSLLSMQHQQQQQQQQQGVSAGAAMHPMPVQQVFAPPPQHQHQQPVHYHYPQPVYAAQAAQPAQTQQYTPHAPLHKPVSTPAFRHTLSPPPPSLAPSAKKSMDTIHSAHAGAAGAPQKKEKEKIKTYGRGGAARKIKVKK